MSLITHYCITGKNYPFLNKLDINVIISGSASKDLKNFPENWHKDCTGENISKKNKNFGTLSSHYWIWKNRLELLNEHDWIGISHYRRFWVKEKISDISTKNLNENLLRYIPDDYNFDILLPEKIQIKNLKLSKVFKKGFRNYIRKPGILFNRSKISINFILIYFMVILY